jgi:hypothetical protein
MRKDALCLLFVVAAALLWLFVVPAHSGAG